MGSILTKVQEVTTDYGSYNLRYQIHKRKEMEWTVYGISIDQYEIKDKRYEQLYDHAVIPAFSESLRETEAFFNLVETGLVFPVHLHSLADDWQFRSEYIQ